MTDYIAVLQQFLADCEGNRGLSDELVAALDHAIAACEEAEQLQQENALLQSDRERIASCPWRVQKGCTALCQPPKRFGALVAEVERLRELVKDWEYSAKYDDAQHYPLAAKHSALVARLEEMEKGWRSEEAKWRGMGEGTEQTYWLTKHADDLARVVKENNDG